MLRQDNPEPELTTLDLEEIILVLKNGKRIVVDPAAAQQFEIYIPFSKDESPQVAIVVD